MYYFISNSEDGLRVDGPFDHDMALARIGDLTDEDIQPQYRAKFVSTIPDPYTPPEHVLILSAEVITPLASQRVTEWSL